ncbi:hypothetical protein EV363DRAFT_1152787 [Boletus edulis]|uniref:Uncharacterized protein n=1 Tax=Boletus edulis BED1 TaxID=1328754 RepID=A0AAD4C294_BOLED|nr:hypothetical protein EV363DRAFT_1152787 [Boletus edulis]KAF8446387.1 hypothetical protein L210DRAFT_946608 [Boletus edulis BED1]
MLQAYRMSTAAPQSSSQLTLVSSLTASSVFMVPGQLITKRSSSNSQAPTRLSYMSFAQIRAQAWVRSCTPRV